MQRLQAALAGSACRQASMAKQKPTHSCTSKEMILASGIQLTSLSLLNTMPSAPERNKTDWCCELRSTSGNTFVYTSTRSSPHLRCRSSQSQRRGCRAAWPRPARQCGDEVIVFRGGVQKNKGSSVCPCRQSHTLNPPPHLHVIGWHAVLAHCCLFEDLQVWQQACVVLNREP